LSMFDMISTFSADKKITYIQVITNLHILDSDYFFQITDSILDGNSSSLLLIFDEILQKGFDGHHFILGLAEHFRSLLVASDPNTMVLLDSGDDKKILFQNQASRTSAGVFLNFLSLASTVDIQYKNSKNQRLLVELCLLKMANIPATLAFMESEKKKHSLIENEEHKFVQIRPNIIVKEGPKFERSQFKSTPNIKTLASDIGKDKAPLTESKTDLDQQEIIKSDLWVTGLDEAKRRYLSWAKNVLNFPISHWSLAIEEYTEELTYYLTFSSDLTSESFEKEKATILRFFNENYHQNPQFEIRIKEIFLYDAKPYSNPEKFIYLSKKHPKLQELKLRLGLEAN
jgi:DNA polymerase-3 subunit gamma/tau